MKVGSVSNTCKPAAPGRKEKAGKNYNMETKANSLTIEHSAATLIKFSLPSIISMLCMSCYEMVDGVFVANFVSADALAAINIVYPPITILIGISIMLATGGSAVIAKKLGEKKDQEAKENFTMMILVGFFIGLICILVDFLFVKKLVLMLGATDRLFDYAYTYLFILALSSPAAILQLLFMTFFVTAGKPNLSLILTIASGVTNIVFDYIFMGPCGMGVEGAAIATGMGYTVSAAAGILFFWKDTDSLLHFVRPKWDFRVLLHSCTNGMSEMVSSLAGSVITLIYNFMMLYYAGEDGVAAITIVLYAQFLLSAVYLGFSSGVAPVISYNYGSQNEAQLKRIFRICTRTILIVAVITVLISYILGDAIIGVFAAKGTHIFDLARSGFNIFAVSFLFNGFNILVSSLFTALSNGVISAGISFLRSFVILTGCLVLLPMIIGINGVWLAVPVAEGLTLIISTVIVVKKRKVYHYF